MTYDQVVAHYSKTMPPAEAEAKAKAYAAANPDKVTGAVADKPAPKKDAPKATPPAKAPPKPPAAKTPEPPKPSPAVAVQVPRVVEKETVKVTTAPPVQAPPPPTTPRAGTLPGADKDPLVRAARAVQGAADTAIALRERMAHPEIPTRPMWGGRTFEGEMPSPMHAKAPATAAPSVMKYADEVDMRDYSNGGGWQFTAPQEVPAMREKLKKLPHLANLDVDKAPESDIRELYAEEFGR